MCAWIGLRRNLPWLKTEFLAPQGLGKAQTFFGPLSRKLYGIIESIFRVIFPKIFTAKSAMPNREIKNLQDGTSLSGLGEAQTEKFAKNYLEKNASLNQIYLD